MSSSVASRALILCADDYALHPWVDKAVQELTLAGRLSATSCMTTSPRWREAAPHLKSLRPRLSVGLHFNLTESHSAAVPAHALGDVIKKAYLHQLSTQAMRRVWQQQLDAFEQELGTVPDFIDGHQHVHQLPHVRDALQAELQHRYASKEMPWVRSTAPAGRLWRNPKAAIIALLGGWGLTRKLKKLQVPYNQGFGGVYGFDAPDVQSYGAHMAHWLPQLEDGALVMCHPASDVVHGDAIGRQRPIEFTYLMSDEFGALLAQQHMHVLQGPLHDWMHQPEMSQN